MPETLSDQAEDISQAPSSADSNVTAAIRINQQATSPSSIGDKPRSVSPSLYIVRHRSPIESPSYDGQPSAQHSSKYHHGTDRSNVSLHIFSFFRTFDLFFLFFSCRLNH